MPLRGKLYVRESGSLGFSAYLKTLASLSFAYSSGVNILKGQTRAVLYITQSVSWEPRAIFEVCSFKFWSRRSSANELRIWMVLNDMVITWAQPAENSDEWTRCSASARIRNAADESEKETAFSPNGPHLLMTIKLRYPNTRHQESPPLVRPFFI